MARGRMVKPEFWNDEKLSTISRDARLTFIGIWNQSDDYAVVKGNHIWLKNIIFPYDDINKSTFEKWMEELLEINALIPFVYNSEKYYYIKNFLKHQTINKPSTTRNPEPPEDILTTTVGLPEGYRTTTVGLPSQVKLSKVKLNKEEVNTNSSERYTHSEPPADEILKIPLVSMNKKTKQPDEYTIYQTDIDEWEKAFPAVDIIQTLNIIRQWNISNKNKRKTSNGIRNHITQWFAKEQNRGGNKNTASETISPKPTTYAQCQDAESRQQTELLKQLREKRLKGGDNESNQQRALA